MHLRVRHIDINHVASDHDLHIGLPQFLKSAATVGTGDVRLADVFIGGLSTLFYWRHYFDWPLLRGVRFVRPSGPYYDPTQISDFSTLVGRAIADICARHFSKAIFLHTYEAAMLARRLVMTGPRPDFYCDNGSQQFALEAKGLSDASVSDTQMSAYKQQAQSGPLPVHFAVASATYRIYDDIATKYYDPPSPDAEYSRELNGFLARHYYARIFDWAGGRPSYPDLQLKNGIFLRYALRVDDGPGIRLLVNRRVAEFMQTGDEQLPLWPENAPKFRAMDLERVFTDTDGIGIELG